MKGKPLEWLRCEPSRYFTKLLRSNQKVSSAFSREGKANLHRKPTISYRLAHYVRDEGKKREFSAQQWISPKA
jgi:hypothetical protein